MEIKVGDKVRVREDAPKVYRDWVDINWTKVESYVAYMDGDAATIKYEERDYFNSDWEYLPIPTKYLVKVDGEAKEPKFKVGDKVITAERGKNMPMTIKCKTGKHYYALEEVDYDIHESYLEPYTEPSLDKDPSDITEETANNLSNVLEGYCNAMQSIADNFDWQKYTADLAKEVALKVANRYNDPEEVADYAVKVAKAVVEELKKK